MTYGESCTIGVAITIPDPWGSQLQERRAAYGDAIAWTIPTHVTLLPPTRVPVGRLAAVDAHLHEAVAWVSPFDLELLGTGTFRPVTQTSFLALTRGAAECERLADAVRTGPLRRSLPFPYHPHVTMAVDLSDETHDLVEADLRHFHLSMTVRTVERFELTDHGVWEPMAEHSLGRW